MAGNPPPPLHVQATSPCEPDDLQHIVHHTQLPHTSLSLVVDRAIRGVGHLVSYIWLVLLAVIVTNVTIRYVFGQGRIEFEELQWHLYAIGFLFGLSYCLESDNHVRVDVLYGRLSLRAQAWVELVGLLVFLLPFIALVLIYAVPFVTYAYGIREVSEAPGGLPMRWAIKAFLPLAFVLLAIAVLSRLSRVTARLLGWPAPRDARAE